MKNRRKNAKNAAAAVKNPCNHDARIYIIQLEILYNALSIHLAKLKEEYSCLKTIRTAREARIDPTLPVNERLRLFAAAIGDPHRFRVGDTEVEVLFDDSAPSLQACLTGMCRQLQ